MRSRAGKGYCLLFACVACGGVLLFLVLGPTRVAILAMTALRHPPQVFVVDPASARTNAKDSGVTNTLYGFTPFPYDDTLTALKRTHDFIVPNSTLYALHFDDGIPWREALADAPFPDRIRREWNDMAKAIPKGHIVYLAFAPLDTDRKSLAPATGNEKRLPLPAELRDAPLDDPKVKRAYLNYARRAVRLFHPYYLNLGIEAGEVLSRDFDRWPRFVGLYDYVRAALKREYPRMQIGISFGLGDLRADREAKAARVLIDKCDYVGLSFYPYASAFEEVFGAPPYGNGPDSWRKPLAWVRAYTSKPIAICETGYSTQTVDIPQFGLHMPGGPEMQTAYVRDLFEISGRDHYAFVIWFLAVDYDRLYAKMPPGSDAMKLWRNIGLIDGELRAKPAWEIWQAGVAASLKRGRYR